MTDLDTRLFAVAAELDSAHHALSLLADGASDDTQYVLYFVATYIAFTPSSCGKLKRWKTSG